MTRNRALALTLAGAVMFVVATPACAQVRGPAATANPWHRATAAAGTEAYAQGSRSINQNGERYRAPDLCAYPRRTDSDGAPVFERGCRLP